MEGDFGAWHVSENEKKIVRNFEILEKRIKAELQVDLNSMWAQIESRLIVLQDRIVELEKASK